MFLNILLYLWTFLNIYTYVLGVGIVFYLLKFGNIYQCLVILNKNCQLKKMGYMVYSIATH